MVNNCNTTEREKKKAKPIRHNFTKLNIVAVEEKVWQRMI
jgi:hypothetical protein